jgi:hypothetical protein
MPTGVYIRSAETIERLRRSHIGRPAWNRGRTKNPLGHCRSIAILKCPTCGAEFGTQIRNLSRGGGRFCSKRCNPSYRPREVPSMKYRRYNLRKYGLTPDDYEALLASQGGTCAICGESPRGVGRYGRLVVDHEHASGKIRGLLCSNCNRALGWFRDSPSILRAAESYLLDFVMNREGVWVGENTHD